MSKKNDLCFATRIKLLENDEFMQYNRILEEMIIYNEKIDEDIVKEVQSALDLNESVLLRSHELYQ